jgi:tetratricopeptide (TPR) repeat protein
MNEYYSSGLKEQTEIALRALLVETLKSATETGLPDIMLGIALMNASGNFCKRIKENYAQLKKDFETSNEDFDLSEQEWDKLIDNIHSKVLGEFIELPEKTEEPELRDNRKLVDDIIEDLVKDDIRKLLEKGQKLVDLGNQIDAISFYKEAYHLANVKSDNRAIHALTSLAKIYQTLGESNKCLEYYYEALIFSEQVNDSYSAYEICKELIPIEKELGKFSNVEILVQKYNHHKDIFDEEYQRYLNGEESQS